MKVAGCCPMCRSQMTKQVVDVRIEKDRLSLVNARAYLEQVRVHQEQERLQIRLREQGPREIPITRYREQQETIIEDIRERSNAPEWWESLPLDRKKLITKAVDKIIKDVIEYGSKTYSRFDDNGQMLLHHIYTRLKHKIPDHIVTLTGNTIEVRSHKIVITKL